MASSYREVDLKRWGARPPTFLGRLPDRRKPFSPPKPKNQKTFLKMKNVWTSGFDGTDLPSSGARLVVVARPRAMDTAADSSHLPAKPDILTKRLPPTPSARRFLFSPVYKGPNAIDGAPKPYDVRNARRLDALLDAAVPCHGFPCGRSACGCAWQKGHRGGIGTASRTFARQFEPML